MNNPEKIDGDRRGMFALAALPLLVLGSRGAQAAPAAPCVPANLPTGQIAQRKALKLRVSTDPAKQCSGCMYFSGPPACGRCQLAFNGPVEGNNVCDSWTKKAT